ncbi:MAG: arginase family protein [Chthoniobacterales bacterium]
MKIEILLVPYDSGRRGERMGAGPEALVGAGLVQQLQRAGHEIRCRILELSSESLLGEFQAALEIDRLVSDAVREGRESNWFPLVVAGNCGATLGVVAALGPATRVIWADAHGDFNTPDTSISGFLDGMSLARLTGRCWGPATQTIPGFVPVKEGDVWLIGARDVDPMEEEALASSDVCRISAPDFNPTAFAKVVSSHAASDCLHLHLDLDVLDPAVGYANGFAAAGGLTAAQLTDFCSTLAKTRMPDSLTISSYDPKADAAGNISRVAVETACALFGGH